MNGNRMKYASTPTFGMQKRGFLKKSAPVRQLPETPDFSKAPGVLPNLPMQQAMPTQPPFAQPTAAPTTPFAQPSPVFPPFAATAPSQPAQVPFAAPSFVPMSSGMNPPFTPYAPVQAPVSQPLPLGNTAPAFRPVTPFSATRSQGYAPMAQPAAAASQPVSSLPGGGSPVMPASPAMSYAAQTPLYPPVPSSPFVQTPPIQAPSQPVQSQSAPLESPRPAETVKQPRRVMDADRLWGVFLFGLLPLLFIPCLFVSGAWNAVRYAFLALTVVGLGGMWYRQLYGPSPRLIISMLYVALCVAVITTLLQGGRDARQVSATFSQPTADVQQTVAPQEPYEGGAPVDLLETPTPPPPASGPSQAEVRLQLFMALWQVNNPTEMVELVQPSWRRSQQNASESLFKLLKNRTPVDYTIEEIDGTDTDNSRTVTMRATIDKNNGKAPSMYRFMVMMVKEGEDWYVNPNSLATNEELKQDEENVVNNRNASGNATEPPRTTVSPAPASSALLYYNEGANNYHLDPNCSRVAAEYLPFDHQFPYSELKTVRRTYGLTPCLSCNAPTDTMD